MIEDRSPTSPPAMPPEELLAHLPEKGIPATSSVTVPLVMLPDDAVPAVMAATNLGLPARIAAERTQDPERFINLLLETGETKAVLGFLAWSLPKRLALWWAFDCCWTTILDQERHLARERSGKGGDKPPGAGASPPPASHADSPSFKKAVKEATKKARAANDKSAAAIPDIEAEFEGLIQRFTARYSTPSTPGVASELEQSVQRARVGRLKVREALIKSKAGQREPKPPTIKHPEPKSPADTGMSRPRKPTHPLHESADRRRLEGRLRGMAASLQWILNPCQENAAAAFEALPSVHDSPAVAALAKTTFWCGENMSVDPQKPQVPPPASLPRKGVADTITKTSSIKHTSWSRADKTNWYLDLGLRIAAGKHPWDQTNERFDRYMTWALDQAPEGRP